jgi:hypothetical protein
MTFSDSLGPWAADRALELSIEDIALQIQKKMKKMMNAGLRDSMNEISREELSNRDELDAEESVAKPMEGSSETIIKETNEKEKLISKEGFQDDGFDNKESGELRHAISRATTTSSINPSKRGIARDNSTPLKRVRIANVGEIIPSSCALHRSFSSIQNTEEMDESEQQVLDSLVWRSDKDGSDPFQGCTMDELDSLLQSCKFLAMDSHWY